MSRFQKPLIAAGVLTLAGYALCSHGLSLPAKTAQQDSEISALEKMFANPPDAAKIMMRWWWFGPAVTEPELRREMQEMKDTGIGGFEVQPVYPLTLDDPSHGMINIRYLSPPFLQAVRYTARTARELGLRMDMTLGSGWPFGGPHISRDLAAMKLRCVTIPHTGRKKSIPMPPLDEGEQFIAAFIARGEGRKLAPGSVQEITSVKGDELILPALPSGSHTVLVFIAGRTGMKVKRAAVGAEGWVLDHYRREALEKHLAAVGDPLIEAGSGDITAAFCDSFEVMRSDWTSDLLEEFHRRRGYELKPYLPALVGDIGSDTAAIRHDWGKTLTELFNERFMAPLQDWCHRHRVACRVQAYGEPPAALSSYLFADLAEGEQGDESGTWSDFTPARWASSAGHAYRLGVVSGETWTWIHSPVFRATPLDLKAGADVQFLEGITQLVGQGWPYSPPAVGEPGWYFYAAGALDSHNPWWFAMPDLAGYLQRVSFMLRQGTPVNDVAVYLPTHDAWAGFSAGQVNLWEAIWARLGSRLLPRLLAGGYGVEFVDDEILSKLGRIEGGAMRIGDQQFRIVILPAVERIPLATLQKLADFSRAGGVLIATRRLPALSPGLQDQINAGPEIGKLVAGLFQEPSHPAHFVPDEDAQLSEALARFHPPDVTFTAPAPSLGFIHRRTPSLDIYFLANTGNQPIETTATFRIAGKNPEWWEAFSGATSECAVSSRSHDRTTVALNLEPYGSGFVVFGDRAPRKTHDEPPRQSLPEPLDLTRGWDVSFEGLGRTLHLDSLNSWTDIAETRFFSGHARYSKKVEVPDAYLGRGLEVKLDFGEPTRVPIEKGAHFRAWLESPVREAGEVYVNGRRVGSVWHPPYELEVKNFLRAGENDLEVIVGNLAVNRMAGGPLPNYGPLEARYGRRFEVQDLNLLRAEPSGMLGPVRLVPHWAQ